MNIKLSIITPVLNGEKYIEKCIKSIVNQNYKNIEYIIVDGKSMITEDFFNTYMK